MFSGAESTYSFCCDFGCEATPGMKALAAKAAEIVTSYSKDKVKRWAEGLKEAKEDAYEEWGE